MGIEPMERLYKAFGNVLVHRRRERKWTAYALATAAGLSESEVIGLELGEYGPTFKDFFRLAWALKEEPTFLLIDVIAEWRGDDADRSLYPSRPSSFERLYRLGYHHKIGDFRELERTYGSVAEAIHTAVRLNEQRHGRGVKLLDTVTTYVRLESLGLQAGPNEVAP